MRAFLGSNFMESFRSWTVSQKFLWFALAVLPFQQAFTLQVGFPLKATELLVVAGIVASFVESRRGYFSNRTSLLVVVLAGVVVISTAWALISTPASATDDAYPRGLAVDLVMYTAYAGLALSAFLTLVKSLTRPQMTSAIGLSVRLAAVYAITQVIFWLINSPALLLINGELQTGGLYGPRIPRNGSFLEGNYLGFYAVAAAFVCLRGRDWAGAVLAGILVWYSASTTSILAAIGAMVLVVVCRPTKRKLAVTGIVIAVATIVALIVPAVNRFVVAQLTKLGLVENTFGPSYTYSLRDRTVNAETGFSMAVGNPLLGVGQGRYAHHYWDYIDLTGLPGHYGNHYKRPIANNAYSQIAAETGFIALAILVLILALLFIRARRESDAVLGLVAVVAVGLVAFPAWTNLVPWVMIAIAVVACNDVEPIGEKPARRRART